MIACSIFFPAATVASFLDAVIASCESVTLIVLLSLNGVVPTVASAVITYVPTAALVTTGPEVFNAENVATPPVEANTADLSAPVNSLLLNLTVKVGLLTTSIFCPLLL